MSIRRMMMFGLSLIKNLVAPFKARVLGDTGVFEAETCLENQLSILNNQNIFNIASLIVTPTGYKEGKIHCIVPSNGSADLTVTRETRATRVNAEGLIEAVPYNLLVRSEEFENAIWSIKNTTVSINTINSPNGTLTADSVIGDNGVTYNYTSSGGVNIVSNSYPTSTNTHTISFYLKYNGLNRVRVMYGLSTTMSGNIYVEVNLQLGTITDFNYGSVASNGFIENVGNGWYRVGFSAIVSLSATNNRFGVGLGDSAKTVANGVDGVYIWGAQLVLGNVRKEYQQITTGLNIPRIDYSNGSCPSILIEPQSTNLVPSSVTFPLFNGTGISQTSTSLFIDSQSTVRKFSTILSGVSPGRSDFNIHNTTFVITSNTTYTASIFVRKVTGTFIYVLFSGMGGGVYINLDTNQVAFDTSVISCYVENFPNGWKKIVYTVLTTGSGTVVIRTSNIPSLAINSLSSLGEFEISSPQIEIGSVATSYIPTTGAIATRNADVITRTSIQSLLPQLYSNGFLYVEFYYLNGNTAAANLLAISKVGSSSNGVSIFKGVNTNQITFRINASAVNDTSQVASYSFIGTGISGLNKACLTWNSTTAKSFLNGVKVDESPQIIFPSLPLEDVFLGAGNMGTIAVTRNLVSNNRMSVIGKTYLTDTQAITLTTL
jgi:hypothetical protein